MEILHVILMVLCLVRPIVGECTVDSKSEEKYKALLQPLKGQTVTIKDSEETYSYDIKFCEAIAGQVTQDVGVLQTVVRDKSVTVPVGRITATDIKTGSDWILLTYRDGKEYSSHCSRHARQAHIMMWCDTNNLVGKATVVEENNGRATDCFFLFEMKTSAACTVSTVSSTVSPIQGLSIGSILLIMYASQLLCTPVY